MQLREALEASNANVPKFLAYGNLERLEDMPASQFDGAMRMLKQKANAR